MRLQGQRQMFHRYLLHAPQRLRHGRLVPSKDSCHMFRMGLFGRGRARARTRLIIIHLGGMSCLGFCGFNQPILELVERQRVILGQLVQMLKGFRVHRCWSGSHCLQKHFYLVRLYDTSVIGVYRPESKSLN